MNELDRVLEAAEDWSSRGIDFVLATVVGVRGSTYRGLAARQLVAEDGTGVGTVSGGCLDEDLRRVATEVIESGRPRLIEFDLTADDEAVWGWGIGCNGATQLVVDPAPSVSQLVGDLRSAQRPLAVIHHLGSRVGERTLALPGEAGPYGGLAAAAIEDGRHRVAEVDGDPVMVEVFGAPRRLIVCGAGHDAAPLVRLGAELGFEPIVVDDRRPFLSVERFPQATQFVHVVPRDLGEAVDLDGATSVVIMSHNYLRDLDYLSAVLGHRLPYIGVLGPGERLGRLLDDLAGQEIRPDEHDLNALHGPAGVDIGSEGPLEIAWAVLTEIMAVRRHAGAGFLRDRKGPASLHEYDPESRVQPGATP